MTSPERAVDAAPPRHAMTYRPSEERYEWLRGRAYVQRTTMQALIDRAVDHLRALDATAPDMPKISDAAPALPTTNQPTHTPETP